MADGGQRSAVRKLANRALARLVTPAPLFLWAILRREALYSDMPRNAIEHVPVDHVVRLSDMSGMPFPPKPCNPNRANRSSTLWAALRALEESNQLSKQVVSRAREHHREIVAEKFEERARAAESHAQSLRNILIKDKISAG